MKYKIIMTLSISLENKKLFLKTYMYVACDVRIYFEDKRDRRRKKRAREREWRWSRILKII